MSLSRKAHDSKALFSPWIYDTILWLCTLAIDLFFREIQPRSAWRVPNNGPLIIVAGPHANQFIDSVILMRVLKSQATRRISFLIAEKSMRERFIGPLASLCGSIPVARAMDNVEPAKGKIHFPDLVNDPTLLRGVGTNFKDGNFMIGGTIVFPRVGKESPATSTIAEIIDQTNLRLKKSAKLHKEIERSMSPDGSEKPEGVEFKIAPHIDQAKVFDTASTHLLGGGCIGIFPEGGSHDRTDLLPLKAGVSIMALNTLALDPECGLTIIPCGMNYFHAHKFRSRAVIEFGPAIDVHPDQIKAYKAGGADRRNAVGSLLDTINEGLTAVTQPSPDYETLMLVQSTRRLYNPIGKKLPLSAVVELNRRFIKGYVRFKDDPRVIQLKDAVLTYNRRLKSLGIRDHQVEWGDTTGRPWWLTFFTLIYRIGELLILSAGTLPGLVLFWPVFVISKVISIRKQKKALAGSVVKVRGRDVITTWKLLVSAGLAPALYLWYTTIATVWLYYTRKSKTSSWSSQNAYVPDFLPLWGFSLLFLALMVSVSFAALRVGETGMDIVKSLPPLVIALNPWTSNALVKLRVQRQALAAQVRDAINTFGPEILDNFDQDRIIADPYKEDAYQSQLKNTEESPGNEYSSLSHSRARSLSGEVDVSSAFGFTDPDEDDNRVGRRIRDAMLLRGRERSKSFRREDEDDEADDERKKDQ